MVSSKKYFVSLLISFLSLCGSLSASDRPNFIIILLDDFGYNDIGANTYPDSETYYPNAGPAPAYNFSPDPDVPEPNHARTLTPAIDSLARNGLRMTHFLTSQKCSPSRASLMTGRYDARVSVTNVFRPNTTGNYGLAGLNTAEITLPEILRTHGYATGMVGKWHLGYHTGVADPFQMMPTRHGFQEFYGVPHSNDMPEFCLIEDETVLGNVSSASEQAKLTWRYTERALGFIQRQHAAEKPFFLYLAHTMPHIPTYPSDSAYPNADGTIWPKFKGASGVSSYYDIVMEMDHSVSCIRNKLESLGIDDKTLIIFTSDNGPWQRYSCPDLTSHAVGSAYPLRDSKGTTWEGGVRAPFVAYWPGHIPAGRVTNEMGGLIDLLPTLVQLAGGETPADRTIDGRSLWPLLSGQSETTPHDAYATFNGKASVDGIRQGHWKLIAGKLFDLANDIQESTDLAASHPDKKAELQALANVIATSIENEHQDRGAFTAYQVEMTSQDIWVQSGHRNSTFLRLTGNPGETITVNISRCLGDRDITVNNPMLSFDQSNWDDWQAVTFNAADNTSGNGEPGGAMFQITSPSINAVRELYVFETEQPVPQPATAQLIWPKSSPAGIANSNTSIVLEGSASIGSETDPEGSIYLWLVVTGPGEVTFTDASAAKTGATFSEPGVYQLRFTIDHVNAISSNSCDFYVRVGVHQLAASTVTPLLEYLNSYEDKAGIWPNASGRNGHDWTMAPSVTRTLVDAENALYGWSFPGNSYADGGVSDDLDAYSTASASVEFWLKPSQWSGTGNRVIWETGGDIGAALVQTDNVLKFVVDDGGSNSVIGGIAKATPSPSTDTQGFVHVVGVIDLQNDVAELYLDGQLASSVAIPTVSDWTGSSDSGLGMIADSNQAATDQKNHLGGNDQLSGSYGSFSGAISLMRFYDRALTAAEILANYHALRSPTPAPAGPTVDAGAPQTATPIAGISLEGEASDDGLPADSELTLIWQAMSGAGPIEFSAPQSSATYATFSLPGEYRIWLEADDGVVKAYDEVTITIEPLSYLDWKNSYSFPIGADGANADPDYDGQENGLEYLFGDDPISGNSNGGRLQLAARKGSPNNLQLAISFDKPRDRAPIVHLQQSVNMQDDWVTLSDILPEVQALSENLERYTYTVDLPNEQYIGFLRILVPEEEL